MFNFQSASLDFKIKEEIRADWKKRFSGSRSGEIMIFDRVVELAPKLYALESNCKNCAAPLTKITCEYCGTRYV